MAEETGVKDEVNKPESTDNAAAEQELSEQSFAASEHVKTDNEKDEAEILSEKFNEVNDKYLRLYSDFENFRKQKAKERIELLQTAGAEVIKNLLSVIDDFERAIQSNEKTEDATALKEGFKLIHHKLKSTLERQGLKEMESVGKEFDTDLHEALTNVPAASDDLKGKVVDVAEKGYYLNEKVIRFAKVIVGQ